MASVETESAPGLAEPTSTLSSSPLDSESASSSGSGSGSASGAGHGNEDEVPMELDEGSDIKEEDRADAEEVDAEGIPAANDEGKRVKVYELRDQSWFDRGTGHCKGVYDDSQDIALIIVEPEEHGADKAEEDGPGGFLKDEMLLTTKVEKDDIYARQQDTLIVWTEPTTNLDIALSFQDGEGCEDIWQFICEVQKHLNNLPSDNEQQMVPSSSSPLTASPMLPQSSGAVGGERTLWQVPTLGNIRSPPARERAVEHILAEDYIKQLIAVFDQAEDLESVEDLHTLCTLMQAIIMFNDNGILEYILQDDVFQGVIGMLEYDPEFPSLKASFRQFFREISRFRQVVEIRDANIRTKIHQTYRLQYLKEVVLARLLDDPTFGILNGFIFFNQVDIIAYFQNNPTLMYEILDVYKGAALEDGANEERQKDTVAFLHQLMLMGKTTQVPTRLALYRNLMGKGLGCALAWALRRKEAQILHAGAEMLTLMSEHDANAVRADVLEDVGKGTRSLVTEMIEVMGSTANLGLLSQISDTFKTLLETPAESESFTQKSDNRANEKFLTYIYEQCFDSLFKPLLSLPDVPAALLAHLVELLSFSISIHGHRASYFVMSNPIARKTVGLLHVKEKPLRHASLRFIKACFRTNNHFMNRHFVKSDLLGPMISLMEDESKRDNMLSSACMDILEIIRKDSTAKPVVTYLFETHRARLEALSDRPLFRAPIQGLHAKYEQYTQPPPAPVEPESSTAAGPSTKLGREKEAQEEEYFNASDEETSPVATTSTTTSGPITYKRKRGAAFYQTASGSGGSAASGTGTPTTRKVGAGKSPVKSTSALGLDYEDNSDSEGSTGAASPRLEPASASATDESELADDLGDVAMKMRQKRQREEDDDEGFAGLLGKASAMGGGGRATAVVDDAGEAPKEGWLASLRLKDKDRDKDKDKAGSGKEEGGKKIRLNLGMGKRLGGLLSQKSTTTTPTASPSLEGEKEGGV